jgi:hypothetical protein
MVSSKELTMTTGPFTLERILAVVGPKPLERSANSRIMRIKSRKNQRRFSYVIQSKEDYSDPAGHLVSLLYTNLPDFDKLKHHPQLTPMNRRLRLTCTCPAWQYWGSAYWASQMGYELSRTRETRPPHERDPNGDNMVCKHVCCVAKHVQRMSFPALLREFAITASRQRLAILQPILANFIEGQNIPDAKQIAEGATDDNVEDLLEEYGALVVPDPPTTAFRRLLLKPT